jgi:hypothetical protein
MPSRNARRHTTTGGIGPAPPAPSFVVGRPSFLWCTKCFGKAEANYDGLVAATSFSIDCEFDRLGSVLCRVCNANHDVCESVSFCLAGEGLPLTIRVGSGGDDPRGFGLLASVRDM